MVAASGVVTCIVAASSSLWRMSFSRFWRPSTFPFGFQWYDCDVDQVNLGLSALVSAVVGRCGCTVTISYVFPCTKMQLARHPTRDVILCQLIHVVWLLWLLHVSYVLFHTQTYD